MSKKASSALCFLGCKHHPNLPVHRVSKEVWNSMIETLKARDITSPPSYTESYLWRHIEIIPMSLETPELLLINRVAPDDEYSKPNSLTQQSQTVQIRQHLY